MLPKDIKDKLIKKFRIHPTDTGSSNIQIAILTEEIKMLTQHLKKHKKDHSSRRGLLMKVNERRRLLKYLFKTDAESYYALIKKLGIKHTIGLRKAKEVTTLVDAETFIKQDEEEEQVEEVKD